MSDTRRSIITASVALMVCSAAATADNLYVSDSSLFTVKVFDATTGAPTGQLIPAGGWGSPSGIAVAADGRVYVADFNNNAVYRFSAAGAYIDTFISTNLFFPTGLAFGPDGYLYVANFGPGNNSYIARFKPDGTPVDATPFVPSATGLFDPGAIAFGRDGNLYIADASNGAIDRVTLPGGAFATLVPAGCPSTPFSNPQGLAFGSDQNLYVSDAGFDCGGAPFAVYKYNTGGALLGAFITANLLSTPIDLAFGPDGNLYVTDNLGRVARFNGTTGAQMADFVPSNGAIGPLINPTFLAFSGGAAANIVVTSGSGQTALINTPFGNRLVATVTDLAGNPVQGATITFTAPSQAGPSATFIGGNTAVTNALGVATSNVVVANGQAGGPYNVVAATGSAAPASFALTNTLVPTIPVLSPWALVLFATALLILGAGRLRRHMEPPAGI